MREAGELADTREVLVIVKNSAVVVVVVANVELDETAQEQNFSVHGGDIRPWHGGTNSDFIIGAF